MAKFDYRKTESAPAVAADRWADRPEVPYILPFMAYLLVMLPGSFGTLGGIDWEKLWKTYLPLEYAIKCAAAALLMWYFWPWYTRVSWRRLDLGVIAGLFGTALWVASEYACQYLGIAGRPDPAKFYNPDIMLGQGWQAWVYLCIRVTGPALVVPVMEELFFRDFAQRALIRGYRFQDIPVGTFTWSSLLIMSVLFGINHGFDYFIPGLLYGLLMGVLVIRTKSLGACIVAHGVTNWTLYLYVIYRGDWQFM